MEPENGCSEKEKTKKAKEENKDKLFSSLRDQAIDFKLLTEAAKKANLEKDPEVITALNQMKEQVLLQAFIGRQLNPLVNDAALRNEYSEFLKTFPKLGHKHAISIGYNSY